MNTKTWLNKPVAAASIAFIILSAALVLAINALNNNGSDDLSAFSITIKHYGINAKEIERTIAVPLEDSLYSINDIKSVLTVSENGKASAYITFKKSGLFFLNKITEGRYEAVSEAAQRVYEKLPSSAQKPEIATSTETRRPVWTAALYASSSSSSSSNENFSLSKIIESSIKPALKSVEGVAEVEVSGSGTNEIIIALKPEEAALCGITGDGIANYLAATDVLSPAGIISENEKEIIVMVDGRYKEIADLKNALLPLEYGKTIKLCDIADVIEQDREPDTLARLNGEKTIIVAVFPNYGASQGKLSKAIRKQVEELKKYPVKFEILSDNGKEETDAFSSVLFAALQGALAVALISALLIKGNTKRNILPVICSLVVPYICIVSACMLIVSGFSFNKILLTGIASGLGAAVDTTIICCEYLNKCKSVTEIKKKLREIKSPLISGSLTTIIALLPVILSPFATKEIITIACTIAAVNIVSLVLALSILPPLFSLNFKSKIKSSDAEQHDVFVLHSSRMKRIIRVIKRKMMRSFTYMFDFSLHKPKIICAVSILITAFGVIALVVSGTDTEETENESTIYAQIEFNDGIRMDVVDKSLENWARNIKRNDGIVSVQCSSHVDSAIVLVSFTPKEIAPNDVRKILKGEKIPGGFLYIPESTRTDKIWSITINGDSTEKCKMLSQELAKKCSVIPIVQETVLNFKDGSKSITFVPDRKRIAELTGNNNQNFLFTNMANTLRWNVHGPVAYKRLIKNKISAAAGGADVHEIDVRIRGMGLEVPEKKELEETLLNVSSDNEDALVKLNSVFIGKESREDSSIRRLDRRRVASISVRTANADPRKIKSIIMPYFNDVEIPSGYSVNFDPDAIEAAQTLSKSVFYFLLALLFCYIVIASVNESFTNPLIVLSVVPVSAAVPALCLTVLGYKFNASAACSLLAVCGIAVNSAVLILDNILLQKDMAKHSFYKAVRERFPALMATTGTTILASLPFIFLKENANTTIKVLSIVTVSGVSVSFICSIFLIPSLMMLLGKEFRVAGQNTSKRGNYENCKRTREYF
ncbi:MAG: hypothetical protein Ta2F_04240 [Termitinemataceae bacterium]|nr:MAG: hypothetical protein Ta2F_04240 [Termitinemataceae bacterium]